MTAQCREDNDTPECESGGSRECVNLHGDVDASREQAL